MNYRDFSFRKFHRFLFVDIHHVRTRSVTCFHDYCHFCRYLYILSRRVPIGSRKSKRMRLPHNLTPLLYNNFMRWWFFFYEIPQWDIFYKNCALSCSRFYPFCDNRYPSSRVQVFFYPPSSSISFPLPPLEDSRKRRVDRGNSSREVKEVV